MPLPAVGSSGWGPILNSYISALETLVNAINVRLTTVEATGGGGGGGGPITAAQITDSTATGRSVITAASAAAARTAIGAGTSSLALGVTSTTAKAGDYTPPAATTSVRGLVTLGGDLGGTADAPTVPGLANKMGSTDQMTLAQMAPGAALVIDYYKNVYGAANAWPATRPTTRTDLDVTWRGPTDPGAIMLVGDMFDLTGP